MELLITVAARPRLKLFQMYQKARESVLSCNIVEITNAMNIIPLLLITFSEAEKREYSHFKGFLVLAYIMFVYLKPSIAQGLFC